jgi:hypothetical protein
MACHTLVHGRWRQFCRALLRRFRPWSVV